MPSELYWLVGAAYSEGNVKLTFIKSPEHTIHVTQEPFTPYFYGLPVSTGEPVTRRELLSGKQLQVARIPSSKQVKVDRVWERDLDPALSYVYDRQLRFGGPHQQTEDGFKTELKVSADQKRA